MKNKNIIAAPSILAANFCQIEENIKLIEQAKADWVHLDVMDGQFVPVITFGSQMVKQIKQITKLPLDVHLMIEKPENQIPLFLEAGADFITFHIEASVHAHRLVQMIKEGGAKAGIAIVPSTPISLIKELLPFLDLVLIMSVNPGYGGQKLIPQTLNKVEELSLLKNKLGYNYLISIDGGVNQSTISEVRASGIDAFVAGSAFFNSQDPAKEISLLKG